VDQIMGRSTDEKGADKANAVRKSQQKDRQALARDIEANQKTISQLNDEAAPIRAENRKVEAEVGPIKYIAAFIYGANPDSSILERAVTWIIILIVIVFDPLAVIMLLASQMTFGWNKEEKGEHTPVYVADVTMPDYEPDDGPLTEQQIEQIKETASETSVPEQKTEFDTVTYHVDDDIGKIVPSADLDAWNKMIEEAEKAIAHPESTVEERVAKGETYIDGDGKEVNLDESFPEPDFPSDNESKKKTYMIKDELGKIQVKDRE